MITCEVTGNQFPNEYRVHLRTCGNCGALINTWRQAYLDSGTSATHWPGECAELR